MKNYLRYSLIAVFSLLFTSSFAADAYKELTFPDENSENNKISSYEKSWTATIGSDSWTISNFNNNSWNNWTCIRCGRKDYASVASIATAFAMDKAIGNVVVTIDKMTASKVNSIKLEVASDADFSNIVETVNAEEIEAGDMTFKVGNPAANLYYRLVFDCASASANGVIQISKVAYYEEGKGPVITDISNTPETAYTVAKAKELIDAGEGLATKVYVKGIITQIDEVSTQYGNATYYINDTQSTDGQLSVFRGYSLDGEKFTSEDEIKVGDNVIIYGQLSVYSGNPQVATGSSIYSINGTTGIDNIAADGTNENAPVYNLAGQRVSKATKGILIQNGKKFINK